MRLLTTYKEAIKAGGECARNNKYNCGYENGTCKACHIEPNGNDILLSIIFDRTFEEEFDYCESA